MTTSIKSARESYINTLRQLVTEKEGILRQATVEFENARTELESVTGNTFVAKAAKGKPGPKPGSKRTAAKTATPKGKPGPKPGSKRTANKKAPPQKKAKAKEKAPKTAKRTSKASDTTTTRRTSTSGRPPLKQAIATVIGSSIGMDVSSIIDGLNKKNWMPDCQNERGYVSYTLSTNKDVFERVSRGNYRVIDGVVFKPRGAKAKAVEAEATTTVAKPIRRAKSVAQKLQELGATGSDVTANPFSS